jgi:catechol 2,3-dioxygenase-like lactoylglutathione lyase family enzyme
MVEVRYLVHDVNIAVAFYCDQLGFTLQQQYGPAMAIVTRGDLSLWLAGPMASASKPMPDGTMPAPGGGWARFVLPVSDLTADVARLKSQGVVFRNDIVVGPGGQQVLISDPSGNLIELFETAHG